ncbi:class I SAM-dependent methyltransferase [Ferroacidibacillus organovorans]|uniref:Methyltransferase n=1 Tax=Ferroacidibacillus organovorans TaxID=1765683 RepID=A0A162RTQ3_9BACL|nr:class I SAM-dependent methyltransferase [Ferroacidibacillus organovorans]KYP79248.1 methyltransferase [Ferroacidibacillus organovorans]OAG87765.1 methyltransferase [Ferroacidibacillus organovorans]OPG15378.1 SAM-dependent methyltransferase [Ferroacidibacillus organovorans]
MGYSGPDFYDQSSVYDTYMQRRSRSQNPNDTIEKPIFMELVGGVKNQAILDLGSGNADFGLESINNGCRRYVGVEGSKNMVNAGRNTLQGTQGEIIFSSIEDWDYPEETFDLVVSRLALHYIKDVEACFQNVYKTLVPGGQFVFSVEHPVLTSCARSAEISTRRADWIVDHYFETGERISPWLGSTVLKYHRTIDDYFSAVQKAGLSITSLRESRPSPSNLDQDEYIRRLRIPLFLFISSHKAQDRL